MPSMWNNDEDDEKPPHQPSVHASTRTGGAALMEFRQIKKCRLVYSQGNADQSFKSYQPWQKTCYFLQGHKELSCTMEKGFKLVGI